MESIYFDWAATAPLHPELPEIISKSLLEFKGNPSSVHSEGKIAKKQIDSGRNICAKLLEIKPEQLIFTSGGTESNSIILSSLFLKKPGLHLILSAIEHPSIYEYASNLKSFGYEIDFIKPAPNGIIDTDSINKLLKPNTVFVSIMTVNNETGAIQPIDDIVIQIRNFEKINGRKIHIHTDAVQALGKIPFQPGLLNIDSASFSAHKIGGPKGVGMLFLKKPLSVLSSGGGQEFSIRPGTENVTGITAFSKAMELIFKKLEKNLEHAEYLQKLLIKELSNFKGIKFLFDKNNSKSLLFSPYITSITVSPVPGEVLVRILNDQGIQISTGSACSSRNRKKQIRVLLSSGVEEKNAAGSIRISTGWTNTEDEIISFCSILKNSLLELQKYHK